MKMIEVLNMMAEGKIEYGAKLKVFDIFDEHEYEYINDIQTFRDEEFGGFYKNFSINSHFLNLEVELIPPKEKKYLVKFNMRWWIERFSYLNYYEKNESIELNTKQSSVFCKASFTKSELQSIKPVREFLEDMEGKYTLIEVEDNE